MGWMSDVRYVLRALRRSPTFTLAAVATLALSIGATTAIFSTVNGILLQPLPFPSADRLVLLCERHPSVAGFCIGSPPNAADWAAQSKSLEAVGIARDWPFLARDDRGTETLDGGIATASFFRVLGVTPALGRLLTREDEGGGRVVVLSHALWQSRFGADRGIVGRTITLDNAPYTVVGVLPVDLAVPQLEGVELWAPLPFDQRLEDNRKWRGFKVYGRLAPGVSLPRAQDELNRIAAGLAEQHPETNQGWTVSVTDLRAQVVGAVQPALYVLLGAVGFVLLIGCANVANLLLARITHRGRELAVRAALGAGRWAALRLVLCESLLLAALGGGVGFLLSYWGLAGFVRLAPRGIPRLNEVTMDWRVLAFAMGISVLASLLFGAAGFARAARVNLGEVLHGRDVAPARRVGVRGALVIAETALALMLLTGAGLLLKSFTRLAQWNPGFDVQHLTTTWLLASDTKYTTRAQVAALWARAADEMRALPGVVSVGEASAGPVFGGTETGRFRVVGRDAGAGDSSTARWFDVDAGYFATLGVPLLRGRGFAPADAPGAPDVAIVNDAMARRYWPGQDPLGRQVVMDGRTMTIVGIVGDVRPLDPDAAAQPEIYWPNRQAARWATYVILRTAGDPASVARSARRSLQQLDPDLSVSSFQTLDARFARQLVYPRFVTLLMATFAAIALLLAAVGVYGVIAYGVARRTREIGIQMALGATQGEVVRGFVRQGMLLAAVGVVLGAAGALAVTPVLRGLLAGVQPGDPVTFIAVAVVLLLVALAASYVPARRASGVSAMEALRSE
jgi:putative ABC transport system permease protein